MGGLQTELVLRLKRLFRLRVSQGVTRSARPTSNVKVWNRKLERNIRRDEENLEELRQAEWRVFVVWECEVDATDFEGKLRRFVADREASSPSI